MKKMLKGIIFAATLIAAASANAGLLGNQISFTLKYPGINGKTYGQDSAVVQDGTTLGTLYGGYSAATFHEGSIDFTQSGPYINNVYYIISGTDLNITGITGSQVDADRLTFDANNIYVNVGQINGVYLSDFTINVQTSDVPEPASLALLGAGLAAVGVARRRKSTQN